MVWFLPVMPNLPMADRIFSRDVSSPYSARVRKILERYSPDVRTASIDEFFVDFAGCESLYAERQDSDSDATIERVVWQMRDTIQSELGLPSSAGIGATRAVAKIASGLAKPAGVLLVPVGEEERRFAPLPVRKVPGIGPVMESRLAAAGITTREACGNSVRNVTACPAAGVCRTQAFDVTPYADAMTRFLLRHDDTQDQELQFSHERNSNTLKGLIH